MTDGERIRFLETWARGIQDQNYGGMLRWLLGEYRRLNARVTNSACAECGKSDQPIGLVCNECARRLADSGRDAERWRWARAHLRMLHDGIPQTEGVAKNYDAAVDAAIAKEKAQRLTTD